GEMASALIARGVPPASSSSWNATDDGNFTCSVDAASTPSGKAPALYFMFELSVRVRLIWRTGGRPTPLKSISRYVPLAQPLATVAAAETATTASASAPRRVW